MRFCMPALTSALFLSESFLLGGAPTLIAPADGSAGQPADVTLEVAVESDGGAPVDVTFYGRRTDFTVIVLPGTQRYSELYPEIYTSQTRWIVENEHARNIVFVSHEGDIVQHEGEVLEWQNADFSMSLLDGKVPYAFAPGNLDKPTIHFNQLFPFTRYENEPWYAGHHAATNDNSYQLISAAGIELLFLHLDQGPSSDEIAWGSSVLEDHPERLAILTTHCFLKVNGTRTSACNAPAVWDDLVVPSENLRFVLSGHFTINDEAAEAYRSDIVGGRAVHQILTNYQSLPPEGGNGFLRILRFAPAEDRVHVSVYSPWLDEHRTGPQSQFTIDLSMDPSATADFVEIGRRTDVARGSTASVVWSGLASDVEYEWYAEVEETGMQVARGPLWRFRTGIGGGGNRAPVADDQQVVTSIDTPIDVTLTATDPDSDPLTYSVVMEPALGVLQGSPPDLTYIPLSGATGTDSFTFRANDGEVSSNLATVTILVSGGGTGAEVILDNGDPGTSSTGLWQVSSAANPWGETSLYTPKTAAGVYTFELAIPGPGEYDVHLWWTEGSSRSRAARVEVEHAADTDTLTVDQTQDGGQWNLIGRWVFDAAVRVRIVGLGDGYTTCADALRIVSSGGDPEPPPPPPPGQEIILDNGQPGTSSVGRWEISSATGFYGSDSLYSPKLKPGTYLFEVPVGGTTACDVHLWWTQGSSRETAAPVRVEHTGGTDTVTVDQTRDGGRWNRIGEWTFGATARITIVGLGGERTTCADAVRLVPVGDGNTPPEAAIVGITPDPADLGELVSFDGAWSDADGDGVSDFEWTSDLDGLLSSLEDFSTDALSPGTHVVSFRVRDARGVWSSAALGSVGVVDPNAPPPPAEVILDDGESGTSSTGTWSESTAPLPYGARSLYASKTAVGAVYTFEIGLAASGEHEVWAWWTAGASRGTAVPIDVVHATGTGTVQVNQTVNGGRWNLLGRWRFGAAARIEVNAVGNGQTTCADAVRLVRVGP
jgi:hypothetical protein